MIPHPANLRHSIKHRKWLHEMVVVAGILGPLMTLPQIFKIWIGHDASGVSAISWGSYFILAGFWLAYAIEHHELPVIINYICWMIMHILVFVGIMIYG